MLPPHLRQESSRGLVRVSVDHGRRPATCRTSRTALALAATGCLTLAAVGWSGAQWVDAVDRRTRTHAVMLREQVERALDILEELAREPGEQGREAREAMRALRARVLR